MKNLFISLLYLPGVAIFSACIRSSVLTTAISPEPIAAILFVDLECFKMLSGKDTCREIQKLVVPGEMKRNFISTIEDENSYVCLFLDSSYHQLYKVVIDHPTERHRDVYKENGEIFAATTLPETGNITLRAPYSSQIKWLKIQHFKKDVVTDVMTLNLH